MIADYDEDTHFCLKCHTTILGLDSYVSHRKNGCSKESPKSPLPSQLLPDESLGLKADDFFSSLELQSSSKKSTNQTSNPSKNLGILTRSKTTAVIQASSKDEITHSKSGKNVWIGGHQLKLGHGDNQSKLFKAVANLERRKDEPEKIEIYVESDVEYEDYDYDDEEFSSDEDAPPRNHTGGKWKPSSPISWEAPPPSHTGGKWKPPKRSSSPPPNHTKGKWKPSFPLSPKDTYDYPPTTFTGSKWTQSKAKEIEQTKKEPEDLDEILDEAQGDKKSVKITDDSPLRKSSGKVQYWCTPCSRQLASKVVYERHLKSELHFKRMQRDQEFDSNQIIENPILITKVTKVKKRHRKKIYTRCEVCKSKVNKNLIGKHLISHYHCRKGDISTPIARQMVLENFHSISLQSPFQCSICKFYFNYEDEFLKHWISEYHKNEEQKKQGVFWCSFCKNKSKFNEDMYNHLISSEHKEVVAVINRSVPIIIKKIKPIKCEQCHKEFLLNLQLIQHCKREGHTFTLTNQSNFECLCGRVFKSEESLRRHKIVNHKTGFYYCTPCNRKFDCKQEARRHRSTAEHRYFATREIKEKHCEYCKIILPNFIEYKSHVKESHPDLCSKCSKCGETFAVSQELTSHIRLKACRVQDFKLENSCDKCVFSSSSTAELLFHKVLHTEPIIIENENEKVTYQFKCPLCEKPYPKNSLLAHLRIHTSERPYVCQICNKGFASKSNCIYHYKRHTQPKTPGKETTKDKSFLCSTCGAKFKKKFILQQHMTIHTGKPFKCPEKGCMHSARSQAALISHMKSHSDVKNFGCNLCEYKGKTKKQLERHYTIHTSSKTYNCTKCSFSGRTIFHLKRHLRVHTGSKPFKCPYCVYKCNNLENLRKHILSTNKHPDKFIYECKLCQFKCNFAKNFKDHLMLEHSEQFPSTKIATTYIAGIYDEFEDGLVESDDYTKSLLTTKPKVLVLQKMEATAAISQESKDPIVTACNSSKEVTDEILPMFVVSKDDNIAIDNLPETWNLTGNYDVEESGELVPFTSDSEVLFQEHF